MKKINLKLYFKKRKQRISVSGISPHFDWLVIVGISLLFLLCGMVYAIYLYMQVNNGSLFEVTEDQSIKSELDQKRSKIKEKVDWLNARTFDESDIN